MGYGVVVSNLFWRFFERVGAQGVTFIVSIILARLLDPEIYGTVALVTVITTLLQTFVDSGLGNALIQKKDADELDFSTVFYFNLVVCIFLYVISYFLAPLLASFYNSPNLVSVIRVHCLSIVISGIKNVQQAYVSRNMLFKKFFFSTIGGTVCAAAAGISMAYAGYGVWALVIQNLVNTTIDTAILWLTVEWRPKAAFSIERLKELFRYGWKLLAAQLITVLNNEVRQLVIGKVYSKADLAFYNQGDKIPSLIVNNINTSIDSVLFPTLSAEQDSAERVKIMTRQAIKVSSYIMMPLMMGLAVCASNLVKLVLTEKWLPCVPYLQIFCFVYAFYPVHTANLNAIKAMGHSEIYLKLEMIKVSVGMAIMFFTLRWGVIALAVGYLISTVISQVINSWPNRKLIGYGYIEQLRDMLPQIILSIIMGLLVYSITFLNLPVMVTVLIQVLVGAFFYFVFSKLAHISSYEYIKEILKVRVKKSRERKSDD